ncbi:MAG: BamA/TamA family outer membrane protein, partial [Gammaproteobacteria bacterium]
VDGGLGVMGLFFHETEEEKAKRLTAMRNAQQGAAQHLLPPSVSVFAAAATGNKSWFTGGGHMGFFNQGRIRYLGGVGYGDVNLNYFGSGNIALKSPVELKTKASGIFQTIKFKIADSPFFVGIGQRYINANISLNSLGDIGSLLPPDYSDKLKALFNQDVTTSGLGFNLEYDTRDNIFSPGQGYRYTLEQLWFREGFSSDVNYELIRFQGLNYWPVSEKWQLGLKLNSEYAKTDELLPPFATPSISLRGIPAMRYQGNFIAAIETELLWHLDTRWSVLGFVGSGRASNSTTEFSNAENRNTSGLGFRYLIARRYGFNMGADIAQGPEDTVFYITVGSAWR